ncbi:copper resistance protein NlpE N-terminal domain-containing protein [Flavobacteriaceae bacterium F89]|uniref:Copper resistance protein NlpE N-terminal domain-containing protein n=1 Tax=Cerina litoralis TaxID=2874477 RepID=A0AAE3JNQ5_9FLAO|nr:copper resistance protein NlpE N-terminal domain-containing protein [Cerina litoralis]MCG2460156.1 copper resistance protein NlpE N-terminal domain-containing protein [Cerina litoralis]
MQKLNTIIFLLLIVIVAGCKSTQQTREKETLTTTDNSKTSLDWDGVYVGTLPCADCPGIATEMELNKDQTFSLRETYMERDVAPRVSEGTFSWNKQGSTITLNSNGKEIASYLVGENTLIRLGMKGKRITGALADHYNLEKKQIKITGTRWKLTELRGQKVNHSSAFIVFSTENNRVYGNSGCNNFSGSFELKKGNQIGLSQLASTRMACPDMDSEQAFLSAMGMVDNYSISGGTLLMNKARMAPLARFEADFSEK